MAALSSGIRAPGSIPNFTGHTEKQKAVLKKALEGFDL